ncbi:MAG: tyrosine-type recombinase/integrase, partial [candidate division NC10 bacterium]|nr:tyrosine-type recombinase/integrase [candidate division NC10 bacterium]
EVPVLRAPRTEKAVVEVEADDFIFPSSVGTPQDPKGYLRRFFFPALAKAELRRIRFHDLRHTYVALQIQAGANAKYIQQQVGHASYQFTMDQYGGLYDDQDATAAARLEATVFGTDRKNVVGLLSV